MRKASRLGIKTGWGDNPGGERIDLGFEKPGGTENERKHGIIFPINVYPLFENAIKIVVSNPPKFALVDLRLEDGNGLDVVKEINKVKKDSRIVMLTGYGNLPTAVAAVKSGAIDYMAKPVDADDVEAALLADPESKAKPPENPMSADRVKWEHIHRVFELCNRNVSETARRLKMHRRTLQRILSKRSPR